MTEKAKERDRPMAVCHCCNKRGTRWHCPTTNHQCDWVICEPCKRIFLRGKPDRWRAWEPATK